MTDRFVIRCVAFGLALIALASLVLMGALALTDRAIPTEIVAAFSGSSGALSALLARTTIDDGDRMAQALANPASLLPDAPPASARFKAGGRVDTGQLAVVGENGPQVITVQRSSTPGAAAAPTSSNSAWRPAPPPPPPPPPEPPDGGWPGFPTFGGAA